jgi:hypothetical protein
MLKIKQYMINTIFSSPLERLSNIHIRYIFQYLSATSFRVAIDDNQHAEFLEGE